MQVACQNIAWRCAFFPHAAIAIVLKDRQDKFGLGWHAEHLEELPEAVSRIAIGGLSQCIDYRNDDGEIKRFGIIGYDEIFGRKDSFSIDSPMAHGC